MLRNLNRECRRILNLAEGVPLTAAQEAKAVDFLMVWVDHGDHRTTH